jgi:hypothetical protein
VRRRLRLPGLHGGRPQNRREIPLDERNSFLEKIHLPSTLTHIGQAAFNECGFLESIKLPKSLLSIGEEAFCDCWNLEKITCPASLRVIGPRAFQGCINLYQIRLNKGLEAIGIDAFDDSANPWRPSSFRTEPWTTSSPSFPNPITN